MPPIDPTDDTPEDADETIAADTRGSGAPPIARGSLIGRYVVLDRLGVGGMGVVYAAYDPELDRKVALKLLLAQPGHGTASSVGRTRLLREAQALAKLSHPHVVAVHDVGTLDDQVWLAMEYVDGMTLGTWVSEQNPGWPEILRVLVAAGQGLAAAHAAGLVHRDLKPDNIMVARDGRTRVMDFGLARAAGPREDGPADSLVRASMDHSPLVSKVTQAGTLVGTPAYLAPEQWRGLATDARADQFSFCVTAWEVLHRARPFVGDTYAALAAAVLSGDIRPPPRPAIPGWLRRALTRGLNPDPERRFPSMDALLAALARGRAHSRRWRVALATSVLALAAAAVPVRRHLDLARRSAACEASRSEVAAVWNDAARSGLAAALRATGLDYAMASFHKAVPWIDGWTRRWADARAQVCREAEVDGTRSPELHARALTCLDERLDELSGLLAAIGEDAAAAAQRAVSAAAGLSPVDACVDETALERRPAPPDDPETRDQVTALRRELTRPAGLLASGRYVDGLRRAEDLLARAEALGYAPLVVEADLLVGNLAEKTRDHERAADALTTAYVEAGAIGADELAARAAADLAFVVGYFQAKHELGLQWARSAELWIRRLGKTEDLLASRLDAALASIHKARGDLDAAQVHHERTLALRKRLLGPDHPDLATTLNNLANLHEARADSDAALPLYEQALVIAERALGPDHPHVANILHNYGAAKINHDALDEASAIYERALKIRERAFGPDHPEVASCLGNLSLIFVRRGSLAEARALRERSLAINERHFGPEHPEVADSLGNLALILRSQDAVDRAQALEERALAIREKVLGPEHADVAYSLDNLAWLAFDRGDFERAQNLLARSLAIREAALGPDSRLVALSLQGLGVVLIERDHLDEARPLLERSRTLFEKVLGPASPELAVTLHNLAELERRSGDLDAAQAHDERALALWTASLGDDGLSVAFALVGLGETWLARGRPAEALPVLERALALRLAGQTRATDLAEVRFALARALTAAPPGAGRDEARARRLADEAATTFRKAPMRRELAAVEAWLKRHGK